MNAELIKSFAKLEIILNYRVGLDKIDLANCKEKGVTVTSTPDVLTDDVADLAIGLILAALRMICENDAYVRCNFSHNSITEKLNFNHKYYPTVIELKSNCQILVAACSLTKEHDTSSIKKSSNQSWYQH